MYYTLCFLGGLIIGINIGIVVVIALIMPR